jgi:hypothetical protein
MIIVQPFWYNLWDNFISHTYIVILSLTHFLYVVFLSKDEERNDCPKNLHKNNYTNIIPLHSNTAQQYLRLLYLNTHNSHTTFQRLIFSQSISLFLSNFSLITSHSLLFLSRCQWVLGEHKLFSKYLLYVGFPVLIRYNESIWFSFKRENIITY